MSNPGPNIYSPEEERPDYAPSDSSEDEDFDGDGDGPGDDLAFELAPTVMPMLQAMNQRIAGGEDSMPSGSLRRDGLHYKFIPWWTTPDVVLGSHRRPALVPGDDNPSTYAQRFGIDERAPPDDPGRSLLTPISDAYVDVTEAPDWVEDWQHSTFGGYTAAELKAQGAFDPGMDFSDPAHDGLQGGLHTLLERDKWMQPNFEGRPELDPYLHYIIPGTPEVPRQIGRYDLRTNDVLWDAMQPALRLASKFLFSNPPFWQAIQDLYTRRPVDHRLVPGVLEEGVSLTSVWLEIDEDKMYPEARDLRRSNFDAAGITAFVLDRLLHIGFASFSTTYGADGVSGLTRVMPGSDFSSPSPSVVNVLLSPEMVWPLLVPEYSAAEKIAVSMRIASVLLHELTHAVFMTQSIMMNVPGWHTDPVLQDPTFNLGALPQNQLDLLRDLGWRMHGSKGMMRPEILIKRIRVDNRESFQDEPQAEEGFAFENSIWGGILVHQVTGYGMDKDHGFPTTIHVNIHSWPAPTSVPHPPTTSNAPQVNNDDQFDSGWPKLLTEPPPTMIGRQTAIPVTAYSQFFGESFWTAGGPFDKYGHQALRISTHQWEGNPLKSQYKFYYTRQKDVARAFGSRRVFLWMAAVGHLLRKANQYALADYLSAKTNETAEGSVMRKRLHYEKKTWPRNDALLFSHIAEIRRLLIPARGLLETYRRAKAGQNYADAPTMEAALLAYVEQTRLIIIEASEIQRRLGVEVQYLQYLVFGILKQDNETRVELRRYMDIIRFRIQSVLIRMADETIDAALVWVFQQFSDEILPDIPLDLDTILHQRASRVTFMGVELMSTFPSTRQQLTGLAEVITACIDVADDGDLGSLPLDRFNLLVDGAGLRAMRTKQRDLGRLAFRDALQLRPGSPEMKIVLAWNGALLKQKELAQAANGEQRAAIRAELVGDILKAVGHVGQAGEN